MRTRTTIAAMLLLATAVRADFDDDFRREDYEEPAGASFAVVLNNEDDVYGISFGSGTWLKNTPVFGDYFLTLFSNEIEDATYSGVGMTFRIMPHWAFAPFAGAGGSYNYSLSGTKITTPYEEEELPKQGQSYWGGHAEAGFRIWFSDRLRMIELAGRYTWSSLEGERDYWLAIISTGTSL